MGPSRSGDITAGGIKSATVADFLYISAYLVEKGFQERFKRADRDRMTDRNRELVPDNWSLVRERALFKAVYIVPITICFIYLSGKLKLSFDRTTKNISQ